MLGLALLGLLAVIGLAAVMLGQDQSQDTPAAVYTGELEITEICARNDSIIADNSGRYRDYIELYAPEQDVCLLGFTLTDGKKTSEPLGDITIRAGQYRIIFLSDEETGFSLGASGSDTIQVKTPAGGIAAQANTTAMASDQVMLLQDGKYIVTDQASPGFANDARGLAAFREGFAQTEPELVINELMVHNESTLPDENGIFSDVVELWNVTDRTLNLSDFFLSDSQQRRFAYRMPDMELGPGEYLVIYLDGENYIADGYIHANFGLSRGESLYLTDLSGGWQSLCGDEAGEDESLQRGQTGGYTVGTPSLGYANTQEGAAQAQADRTNSESPLVISEVLLSNSGMPYEGVLGDFVELHNRSDEAVSTAGWYLSDGGDPYGYPLPQMQLQPGEYLVIRCSGEETGFGLSRGETLMLTGPDYRHAPLVTCVEGEAGQSISLVETGEETAYVFGTVSLGYGNDQQGHESYMLAQQPQGLQISELMSNNYSYLRGPYGATCDWIELYNAGTEGVDLSGYALTDNPKYPGKYQLPQVTLAPGEYCTILLSEDSGKARQGYQVLPMGISSKGEQIYLTSGEQVVDFVFVPELGVDEAYGRAAGSSFFSQLAKPTPDGGNSKTAAVSADPVAVTAPGSYDGVEYLDVELSAPGEIYYTTNCTEPGRDDRRYTGPIRITKTTVLRVVCYEEGKTRSDVIDLTYLLNENDSLSVVSIVTSPGNLWDYETGIYVDGPNISSEYPYNGANYWMNWERAASISLYEADGSDGFSVNCGLKIFGGYSRANKKKSFACMFRKRYGDSRLEYPVFGEGSLPYYEALVLRASGQDVFESRMRDEVITSLASDLLGLAVQDYRPVALYLNGEYWGVYYIREKINDQYVYGHFGVDVEDVTMTHWSGGDCSQYVALRDYARRHDLSKQEHYDYIASQIDLENYTDFMITQIWCNNKDAGNVKYFTSPGRKWTWILFDMDLAFREPNHDPMPYLMNPSLGFDITTRTFAVRLMDNDEYRDYFIRRTAWQINNVWTEENIIERIDQIQAMIAEDMVKDTKRWNTRYSTWEREVEELREFARERTGYLVPILQDYFGLTDQQMKDYGFPME